MLSLMTWDRIGRQENGLTATALTRCSRECCMEGAARWRQSVAARRAQSPGRIGISLVDSFSLVTFAGLAAKTPAPDSFTAATSSQWGGSRASLAGGCRPAEDRTDWPDQEQANKSPSVEPSVHDTSPKRIAIVFGAAVSLSRTVSVQVPGPQSRNGSYPWKK